RPLFFAEIAGTIVGRQHQTKRVAVNFSGQLYCEIRINNGPSVVGKNLRLKYFDAFQKERTLLSKEDREPLICCNYQLVRFDLCKVRINCKVERYLRGETVFSGQARIKFYRFIHEPAAV